MSENLHYQFYNFAGMQAAGIVSSRTHLRELIADYGFPRPLKVKASIQAAAKWRKSDVHAWLDKRYPPEAQTLPKNAFPKQPKKLGRPPKIAEAEPTPKRGRGQPRKAA